VKLYAVRIFVRDWNESCIFYRDKLGLPERSRDDSAGWAEYDLGGPCFGLQRVDENDSEGEDLVGRFVGVSLQVEDIEASYHDLRARGVNFTARPEKQAWGGSLAFFEDPDGNVLTLLG
jgi:lactoylglutathione lyase